MTKEDKELLLKDLCTRLPFMPKIKITYQQYGIRGTGEGRVSYDAIKKIVNDLHNGVITDMQIFLRPMSSMTEEEKAEYSDIFYTAQADHLTAAEIIDWLNEHYFDYRGLIPKGLAIEAPDGMYNLNREL